MTDKSSEALSCTLRERHLSDEAAIRYLTIGKIVCDLMSAEKPITRQAICCKLLKRLEQAESAEEEKNCYRLIRMLFGRH